MDRKRIREVKGCLEKGFLRFVETIKKRFDAKVLLFGSRAKGECFEFSDYDVIVISNKFHGIPWHKRISDIVKYWRLNKDIHVLPYTEEEFEKKKTMRTIVQVAAKEGFYL